MREWVVGFLMSEDAEQVVLIQKARPPWMAGMLNGVGGKVEPGEMAHDAMVREFEEETGVRIVTWHRFVQMTAVSTEDRSGAITSENGVIHFYRAFVPVRDLLWAKTINADEPIVYVDPRRIAEYNTVPNLRWLVALAAHSHDTYEIIDVVEKSTTLRVEAPA